VIGEKERAEIEGIFRSFLEKRADRIRRLKLDDLDINPFLVRMLSAKLGLHRPRAIVEWLVNQRLERGTVTGFGIALQDAAKVFSEGTGVEGADILKTKQGRHYYIQVKSGPNTIPKDLSVRIAQLLRSAERRNRGSVALYGMCHGNRARVSSIVRKYVEQEGGVEYLSGREFWEFISGEPDCIDTVYEIARSVAESFRDTSGQSLAEVLRNEIDELTEESERTYGKGGAGMWNELLRRNSYAR
jgi:hypothetical protein